MAQHDALLPRPPGGMAPGAALALLVHGGLIAALTLGVSWRMNAPEIVAAELWSTVPQTAAPRVEAPAPTPAPPPPPPAPAPPPPRETAPTEAQIAIERAAKQKLEREKKEEADKLEKKKLADKREADAAEKKKRDAEAQKKAEDDRLAKAREEQIKRMLAGLPGSGAPTSTGSAERSAAPSQAYIGRLIAKIKSNVIFPDSVSGNPAAEVEVTTSAGGTILSRRLTKPSGNAKWDDAVLAAIDRTDRLPLDESGRSPPSITITFRPKE